MIHSRMPFTLVTAALMEIAERERDNGATDFDPGGTIVIRAQAPTITIAETPMRLHDTSGDTWRRKGKRRGRHAR